MENNFNHVDLYMYIFYCVVVMASWGIIGILNWRRMSLTDKDIPVMLCRFFLAPFLFGISGILILTGAFNIIDFGIWGWFVALLIMSVSFLPALYGSKRLLHDKGEHMDAEEKELLAYELKYLKKGFGMLLGGLIILGYIGWDVSVKEAEERARWDKKFEEKYGIEQMEQVKKTYNKEVK